MKIQLFNSAGKINKLVLFGTVALLVSGFFVANSASAATVSVVSNPTNAGYYNAVVRGANLLLSQQNTDGGWKWEITSGITTPSDENNFGITALGLLNAYQLTHKAEYLTGATLTANHLVAKTIPTDATTDSTPGNKFYSSDIEFLAKMAQVTGNTTYSDKASALMTHFMSAPNRYCATGCVTAQNIADSYHTSLSPYPGFAEWDIAGWVEAAKLTGRTEWGTALATIVKADVLDPSYNAETLRLVQDKYYSLGLASALEATALFSVDNTDIKTKLLIEQDGTTGAIAANSEDGVNQTTSYAVLGLSAAGDTAHATTSANFLTGTGKQNPDGGWTESNARRFTEVNSEIIQAIFSVLPADTYYTIQDAINATNSGDTITVGTGTYNENLAIATGTTLTSGGHTADVIINGGITISTNNVTIDGLTIDASSTNNGISTNLANVVIQNNVIKNYKQEGVRVNGGIVSILNNIITGIGSTPSYSQDSIYTLGGATVTVIGNDLSNNRYSGNIQTVAPANWSTAAGLSAHQGDTITATGNTIHNNDFGIHAKGGEIAGTNPVIVAHSNNIHDNFQGFFYELRPGGTPTSNYDATNNYWGTSSSTEITTLVSSSTVNFTPWYTDSAKTKLGFPATVNEAGDKKNATIPTPIATALTTDAGNVNVEIPENLAITGPLDWDGTITTPAVVTTTVAPTPDTGNTASPTASIEVGSGNISLTFDKAVKLTFAGQAGKSVGYSHGTGTFTQITNVCDDPTTPTLDAGADCKKDVGGDLIVWTKHFSTFTTYTQTAIPPTSYGGNGGGGGGGNYIPSSNKAVTSFTIAGQLGATVINENAHTITITMSVGTDLTALIPEIVISGAAVNPNRVATNFSTPQTYTVTAANGGTQTYVVTVTTGTTASVAAAQISNETVGQVLGVSTFRFTTTLHKGSKGDDVTELQTRLSKEGIYSGPITGYFGALTETAVKAFQKKYGIEQAGLVGPKTLAQLNSSSSDVASAGTTGRVLGASTSADAEKTATLRAQLVSLMAQLVKLLQAQATATH